MNESVCCRYTGIEQLKELDQIPGLCWGDGTRPSQFVPSYSVFISFNFLGTPVLGYTDSDSSFLYGMELSFPEFKEFIRRLLKAPLWEQEDL